MTKSTVGVYVRTRPTASFAEDNINIHENGKTIILHLPKKSKDVVHNIQEDHQFTFDGVLHNSAQEEVYETVASDIVSNVIQGYNGTIMAYGQTGAGKTYTMRGGARSYKQRGIIPRTINQIYHEIQNKPEFSFTIKISYLEIYNDQIHDLLSSGESEDILMPEMSIRESNSGGVFVKGLSQLMANNEEEAFSLMFEGEAKRAIAQHSLNLVSSRSHCIFSISIESVNLEDPDQKTIFSKLNLVDLAGSERLGKTNSSDRMLNEAKYINSSLSFLEQVVIALSNPSREHIPYRQCKLTNYLKDSLGGNCKTALIANVWGEKDQITETLSTLKFGKRMKRVSNEPKINVHLGPEALAKKYKKMVDDLQKELEAKDKLFGKENMQYEPFSEEQKKEIEKEVEAYYRGEIEDIEIQSLRHVKEIMRQFKLLCSKREEEATQQAEQSKKSSKSKSKDKKKKKEEEKSKEKSKDDSNSDKSRSSSRAKSRSGTPTPPPSQKDTSKGSKKQKKNEIAESDAKEEKEEEAEEQPTPEETVPSEKEAFETFKVEDGKELTDILSENIVARKEMKKEIRKMKKEINHVKHDIDNLMEKIETYNKEREEAGIEVEVMDDEYYINQRELKESRKDYRQKYQSLKQAQVELQYLTKLENNSRAKLVSQFQDWYAAKYAHLLKKNEETNEMNKDSQDNQQPEEMQQEQQFNHEENEDREAFSPSPQSSKVEASLIPDEDSEARRYYNAMRAGIKKAKKTRR
eukprot:gb/GECH01009477.1/.p1 GENE.gb/GECH01009477.1/~~gb/GECH01009477.1/.p1  ORF type:complete len:748 (+),score=215.94 gb/GECH01009477.1/:1-2244(+)